MNKQMYSNASELFITADCGRNNGYCQLSSVSRDTALSGVRRYIYPIHFENLSFAVEKTIGFNLDGVYVL